jgi:hypothetical protein
MMEPEDALVGYLMTQAALTELIGQRWYPLIIPVNAERPAVAYQRLPSTQRTLAHDGPTGFASCTIQLTVQARSYGQAKDVLRIIRQQVDGFRGEMSGLTVHRIAVHGDGDSWAEQHSMPTLRADIDVNYQEQ